MLIHFECYLTLSVTPFECYHLSGVTTFLCYTFFVVIRVLSLPLLGIISPFGGYHPFFLYYPRLDLREIFLFPTPEQLEKDFFSHIQPAISHWSSFDFVKRIPSASASSSMVMRTGSQALTILPETHPYPLHMCKITYIIKKIKTVYFTNMYNRNGY